ncbi:hypothetical protein P9875_23630 [Janthinobacterium rivuli]|uniref:Uncharacterized protein n=1 Tax=Janthinobacterium rivuli TaxID=2751478 RepID=A0ABY8I2P8_9BURK|nr:hypothetical protein [Janthinobacterium rivuli]WFR78666.1 hypothetical protein P9875_23630 [Janthinobacterium rivuli]
MKNQFLVILQRIVNANFQVSLRHVMSICFSAFFFDGTNNNMKRDMAFHAHSNVARLYRAFSGDKDTHGSDAKLCKLDTQLNVSKGVKARALSLGIDA